MALFTLSQMADDLGCSAKVFSRDVKEKQIPFYSIGKRKQFDPVEVRAHIKNWEAVTPSLKAFPRARTRVQGKGRFAEALGLN